MTEAAVDAVRLTFPLALPSGWHVPGGVYRAQERLPAAPEGRPGDSGPRVVIAVWATNPRKSKDHPQRRRYVEAILFAGEYTDRWPTKDEDGRALLRREAEQQQAARPETARPETGGDARR